MSIEQRVVSIGQRGELHDAGVVDEHIDRAECRLGGVEEPADGHRIADVGLNGRRPSAGRGDPLNLSIGLV
jgi:hypothetical protein